MSKTCVVCGSNARSVIDNQSRVCAACSMFYRRNYTNWTALKCSANESCNLMRVKRRLCPKCRMLKCREIGLRMAGKSLIIQRNGLPVDDIVDELIEETLPLVSSTSSVASTSNLPSNITGDSCWQVNSKLEMLNKAVEIFKRFAERQLFLSSIHQNRQLLTLDGKDVEPMAITLDSYPWMENRVLMIVCEILSEILKDFGVISLEDKIKAFQGVAFHSCLVFKFYLTMQSFPDLGDSRLALYPAYYIDSKNPRHFFGHLDEEKFQTASNIVGPFFQRIYDCAERARRFKPSPVECAALFLLAVYDKLERMKLLPNEAIKLFDRLTDELGQHITEMNLNPHVRLSRLMTCLYDAYMVNENYEDSYSLMGVMFPELRDNFCNQKPNLPDSFIGVVASAAQNTTK